MAQGDKSYADLIAKGRNYGSKLRKEPHISSYVVGFLLTLNEIFCTIGG